MVSENSVYLLGPAIIFEEYFLNSPNIATFFEKKFSEYNITDFNKYL
jgi:hypothetical protein